MKQKIDIAELSTEQLEEILIERKAKENDLRQKKRDAYEGIRADVLVRIENSVRAVTADVQELFYFVVAETDAFREVMGEYGQLRKKDQLSFTLKDKKFKVEVKVNKVKKFDERADIAAARLIEFLQGWIKQRDKGSDDPMYQLGMTMLERNRQGDLDYKSISKLYDLEERFNDEDYSAIMKLFKESNVTEGTATNFYFHEKNKMGVWRKLEPSFNRL